MASIRYFQSLTRANINQRKLIAASLRHLAFMPTKLDTSSQIRPSCNISPSSTFSNASIVDEKHACILTRGDSHSMGDTAKTIERPVELPRYLRQHYWWAYINPTLISILDRKWLVDLLLWGNFAKLRDAAINEFVVSCPVETQDPAMIQGNTLQVSCVYADLTEAIVNELAPEAKLTVIDVVPAQLTNLQQKLERSSAISNRYDVRKVELSCGDASNLYDHFPEDNTFDNILIFFLLHETPTDVRQNILAEACRLLNRHGKIVIIDYNKPTNALLYCIMQLMYMVYEPFANDLWEHHVSHWVSSKDKLIYRKETYFSGLYQKMVITKQ
jgi:ubiquinone/menaquinone biosynthesis C-methylase UbiE